MIIFAGPTLNSQSRDLIAQQQIHLRPPIQRGDLAKAAEDHNESKEIAVVDGYFHQSLSVSHEEIMYAIKKGWKVTGLCSLGAIRAYELRDFGMLGYGQVYQRFINDIDFQDDEVALRHFPGGKYTNLSEPLIHFRACLESLVADKKIADNESIEIIDFMKNRYFGDRTMPLFKEIFKQKTGYELDVVVRDFDQFKLKQIDLVDYLQKR